MLLLWQLWSENLKISWAKRGKRLNDHVKYCKNHAIKKCFSSCGKGFIFYEISLDDWSVLYSLCCTALFRWPFKAFPLICCPVRESQMAAQWTGKEQQSVLAEVKGQLIIHQRGPENRCRKENSHQNYVLLNRKEENNLDKGN